jgi:ABC-type transport system involved in cytochrome bd biosynthesis fused ATPase/permease subunit
MKDNIKKILIPIVVMVVTAIIMMLMINFFGFEQGVMGILTFIVTKLFLNDLKVS